MNEFISQYEYVLAWSVYISAGLVFCVFWWKVTSIVHHDGWRDLLRGISLVMMYTPWFSDETHEHFAPAIVIAFMDFLLGGSDNGLAASLALLIASAFMLAALIARRIFSRRTASS